MVLVSEPVRGRSRATELTCLDSFSAENIEEYRYKNYKCSSTLNMIDELMFNSILTCGGRGGGGGSGVPGYLIFDFFRGQISDI